MEQTFLSSFSSPHKSYQTKIDIDIDKRNQIDILNSIMLLSKIASFTVALVAMLTLPAANAYWEDTSSWTDTDWIVVGDEYGVGHCGSCPPGTTCTDSSGWASCICESGEVIHGYEIGWKTCTECGENEVLVTDGGEFWFWSYCGCVAGYAMVDGHCIEGDPCALDPYCAGKHCTSSDGFAFCGPTRRLRG